MIPFAFSERMRQLLGQDAPAFFDALERPAVRALRVNPIKTTVENLSPLLPFPLSPLPFGLNAFYAPEDKVGALPCHHAGMIYMQDPGAISAVVAAAPAKGLRVLDLCAAPGGKTTQLAAAIGEGGMLVSNEYVPARCRILQGNVERLGLTNTVVTNLSTDALADFYGSFFDLVVADAPCSGEGMFRKYEVATEEWSPENVQMCAARQREILQNAAHLVAPGGRLLYSTCTFSLEENEQNVDWLLTEHPDFSLIPVAEEIRNITANGVSFEGCAHDMTLCRRFYPHLSPGEGQFVALLQRRDDAHPQKAALRGVLPPPDPKAAALAEELLAAVLQARPKGRLMQLRDTVWLAPDLPIPQKGAFAPGVCIGTLQKGRIEPHHQLACALGTRFCRRVALSHGDTRVQRFLRGEELPLSPEECPDGNGYAAVLYEGAPLGLGKIVGDRLKNHYPKGLRSRT